MKSVKLAKAINNGNVLIRTGRNVMGQIFIKFRNPDVKDKIISAYPLQDRMKPESYTNLSLTYSAEQLKNSNLEDLIMSGDIEVK